MRISVVAALLVLLGACSSAGEAGQNGRAPRADSPTSAAPSLPSDAAPGTAGDADAETCAQVRAGIEAFNRGDYEETVARFEEAVPLALAARDDSASGALLAEAVQYYADLPPQDYPEASRSSDDFAKYKQITLGLCADGPPSSEDPGVPA